MELRKERNHRAQPAFYLYHLQDLIDNFFSLSACLSFLHTLCLYFPFIKPLFFPIQLLSSLSKLKHKCKYFWYFICAAAVTMACLKCAWSNCSTSGRTHACICGVATKEKMLRALVSSYSRTHQFLLNSTGKHLVKAQYYILSTFCKTLLLFSVV